MTYQGGAPAAGPAGHPHPAIGEDEGAGRADPRPPATGSVNAEPEGDRTLMTELEAQGRADKDEIANLKRALATSRQIGTAVGVIMASHKVTDSQAFDLLRKKSQTTNRKLRDVAEDVVLTGTLPTD